MLKKIVNCHNTFLSRFDIFIGGKDKTYTAEIPPNNSWIKYIRVRRRLIGNRGLMMTSLVLNTNNKELNTSYWYHYDKPNKNKVYYTVVRALYQAAVTKNYKLIP